MWTGQNFRLTDFAQSDLFCACKGLIVCFLVFSQSYFKDTSSIAAGEGSRESGRKDVYVNNRKSKAKQHDKSRSGVYQQIQKPHGRSRRRRAHESYKQKRREIPTIRANPVHINPRTNAHPSTHPKAASPPDASRTILAGGIIRLQGQERQNSLGPKG